MIYKLRSIHIKFCTVRFVHDAPQYGPNEEDFEDSELEDVKEETKHAEVEMFKVPDIFSEVTSSSDGYHGDNDVTSRDIVKSRDHESRSLESSSSSEDNVHIIMPEVHPVTFFCNFSASPLRRLTLSHFY